MHGAALGLGQLHGRRQADEPHAVAVAKQAAGPQLGVGVVALGHLVRQLHFLLDRFFLSLFFKSKCEFLTVKENEAKLVAAHKHTHKHTHLFRPLGQQGGAAGQAGPCRPAAERWPQLPSTVKQLLAQPWETVIPT